MTISWQTFSMSRMTSSFQKRRMVQPSGPDALSSPHRLHWHRHAANHRLGRQVPFPGKQSRRCNQRSEIVSGTRAPSADARSSFRASIRRRSWLCASTWHWRDFVGQPRVRHCQCSVAFEIGALRRAPLSCGTSPPQVGRLAVPPTAPLLRGWRLAKSKMTADLPQVGEMSGRTEGALSSQPCLDFELHPHCFSSRWDVAFPTAPLAKRR